MTDQKSHWEKVYATKRPEEVSWTQLRPEMSLKFIAVLKPDKDAAIIDIGGGDSRLVDYLLDDGFTNVSVLDISGMALERAKERLGERAREVTWIESDINDFKPSQKYALWHDRAAFHFLTDEADIERYQQMVAESVTGGLIMGTFSTDGPTRCSGLDITQYDQSRIEKQFSPDFKLIRAEQSSHTTPFDTTQDFLFACFEKR